MGWSHIATRQTLRKVTALQRNKVIAARTFGSQAESENARSAWTMAAVATVSLTSAAALTLCEDPVDKFPFVRTYSKSGVADPLTSFAKHAQMKTWKEGSVPQEGEEETPGVSVQATSAIPPPATNGEGLDMAATVSTDVLTEGEAKIEAEARKIKQHSGGLKVFSGNGNMSLSLEIARHLGINLGKATVGRFADGEVNCVIHENVRGKDVYIVQPTCPPVNDNIMELLLMISTLRRASARRITVVIPYYGYARQDRKMQVRYYWRRTRDQVMSALTVCFLGPCTHFSR